MRIAFAHIEKVIDFDTREEAAEYIIKAKESNKPWYFMSQMERWIDKPWKPFSFEENYEEKFQKYNEEMAQYLNQFIINNHDYFTIVVRVPYGKYEPGW